ncbi:MAG: alpha/beta hydrolase, partial [Bdellovibrionales bacterium]
MKGKNDMRVFFAIFLISLGSVSPLVAGEQKAPFRKVVDIAYRGRDTKDDYVNSQCRLDLYLPLQKTDFATVVWFHGGGLRGGNRKSAEAFAKRFTGEGYGVVLVGYRFSPKVKAPAYIDDAAAAVAWTLKNIAKYKG